MTIWDLLHDRSCYLSIEQFAKLATTTGAVQCIAGDYRCCAALGCLKCEREASWSLTGLMCVLLLPLRHGTVEYVVIDRNRGQALVFYPKYDHAQQALNQLRGRKLNGSRLKLDYASQELVELFLKEMQKTGLWRRQQFFCRFSNVNLMWLKPESPFGVVVISNFITKKRWFYFVSNLPCQTDLWSFTV